MFDVGILSRLFGDKTSGNKQEVQLTILEGDDDLEVVGESYRQDALWACVGYKTKDRIREDVIAYLVPDPSNNYDPNAIGVWIEGKHVGFIAKELAAEIGDDLASLMTKNTGTYIALRGVIAGGGKYEDGPGMLGVFLEFNAADFGLGSNLKKDGVAQPFSMGTGQTDAFFTDEADDTYNLSWMSGLSADPSKRILELKKILTSNNEPISRHFVYTSLEEIYYKYKDVLPDAATHYEEVSESHHFEISGSIKEAMILKWGKLPNLVVYKQAAIKNSKEKNFAKALEWVNRGLVVYGDVAFKEETILDLKKRKVNLEGKIEKLGPKS